MKRTLSNPLFVALAFGVLFGAATVATAFDGPFDGPNEIQGRGEEERFYSETRESTGKAKTLAEQKRDGWINTQYYLVIDKETHSSGSYADSIGRRIYWHRIVLDYHYKYPIF